MNQVDRIDRAIPITRGGIRGISRRQDSAHHRVKALIVVAHPDDEYYMAATVYRLANELGAVVDQVVITDGEGGYRYSALAERLYGLPLTDQATAREQLPEIRRRETLASGRILGIRRHHFLGEEDGGYQHDPADAGNDWDAARVRRFLSHLIEFERYEYVFTLLPRAETHGHHRAAALHLIEAVESLTEEIRPVLVGAEPGRGADAPLQYRGLPGVPASRPAGPAFEFPRTHRFGFHDALDYSIVVNWVIAEHKSQGLFQADVGKHDVERFWTLAEHGTAAWRSLSELFSHLLPEELPALLRAGGSVA